MNTETSARRETELAVKNGLTLALSLMVTWSIGLGVRFLLPRALGPETFGAYNFAETFAAAWFVLLSLGMETLLQREAAIRPEIVSEIGGGLLALRTLMGGALIGAAVFFVLRDGRGPEIATLAALFGVGQLAVFYASFLTTALQAAGKVKRLALTNVMSKVVWGAWLLACVVWRLPLRWFAIAFLASELLRAASIHRGARRELGFTFALHPRALRAAITRAAPFYLSAVVLALANKLDVSLLGLLVENDREVGFYSAANVLAGLSLMLAPIMSGVVAPMFSRVFAQSRDAFDALVQETLLVVLHATLPVILTLALGADLWVRLAFGEAFAPAALSLRAISPIFGLTYVAIITSLALIAEGRAWLTTRASLAGICASFMITAASVPFTMRAWPEGGAGVGAAAGSVSMELVTVVLFAHALKERLFSRRVRVSVAKMLAAVGAAIALFALLGALALPLKLCLALAAYAVIIIGTGALTLAQVRDLVQRGRRK